MQKSCKDHTGTEEVQHIHFISFRREVLFQVMIIQRYVEGVCDPFQRFCKLTGLMHDRSSYLKTKNQIPLIHLRKIFALCSKFKIYHLDHPDALNTFCHNSMELTTHIQ